jgi:tRNA wybutosine-synthesizing protein 1
LLKYQPTNLYVTLHAPNKRIFKKECCPLIKDSWQQLLKTLGLLKQFSCNTVIRLTLSKATNMQHPEQYAALIEKAQPKYVEVKGYMAIGGARVKMGYSTMPTFEEILAFAKEIEKNSSYEIINSKLDSHVALLVRE